MQAFAPWLFISVFTGLVSLNMSCSRPEPTELKIIGGHKAKPLPSFAALHREGETEPFCGATLIAPDVLLTAAHCVNYPEQRLGAWLGISELKESLRSRPIEAISVHPQYHAGEIQHDIALVFLRPDQRVKTPPLPFTLPPIYPTELRVLGMGNTNASSPTYPSELLSAPLEELDLERCRAFGGPFADLLSSQICARDGERGRYDACDGDSGGPLLAIDAEGQASLYGLVSWGVGCARPGVPGIYTRVDAYRAWIDRAQRDYFEDRLPLDELMRLVFYHRLTWIPEGSEDSQSVWGAHLLWKPAAPRGPALAHWQVESRGRRLKLKLLREGSRYWIQLTYKKEIWEARVHTAPS